MNEINNQDKLEKHRNIANIHNKVFHKILESEEIMIAGKILSSNDDEMSILNSSIMSYRRKFRISKEIDDPYYLISNYIIHDLINKIYTQNDLFQTIDELINSPTPNLLELIVAKYILEYFSQETSCEKVKETTARELINQLHDSDQTIEKKHNGNCEMAQHMSGLSSKIAELLPVFFRKNK